MPTYIKIILVLLLGAPLIGVLEFYIGFKIYGWYAGRRIDWPWYEARLLRKQAKHPKSSDVARSLGIVYWNRFLRAPEQARAGIAQQGLRWLETALSLPMHAYQRTERLKYLAVFAYEAGEYDKAKSRARQLLDGAPRLHYSDSAAATFFGHLVLGRLALRDGDVASAERHLLKSANIDCSPRLSSYGPNMSLASELLEAGRTDTVIQFLDLCSRFWTKDRGCIARWKVQIAQGESPDFGWSLRQV